MFFDIEKNAEDHPLQIAIINEYQFPILHFYFGYSSEKHIMESQIIAYGKRGINDKLLVDVKTIRNFMEILFLGKDVSLVGYEIKGDYSALNSVGIDLKSFFLNIYDLSKNPHFMIVFVRRKNSKHFMNQDLKTVSKI